MTTAAQTPPGDATIHWYRCPVDREIMRRLTTRSDARAFMQIGLQLLLTACVFALTYYSLTHWPWWASVPLVLLHGTVYSFLGASGSGHELSHRTVFRTRFLNEFFMVLTSFLTYFNYEHFRGSHMKHHQYTVFKDLDLEVVLPLKLRRRDWLFLFTFNLFHFKWTIQSMVRHSLGRLKGEWEHRIFDGQENAKSRHAMFNWARIMLAGHLLLAGVFVYLGQWPLLILVTFAPFYGHWLNFLCGFTQHAGMAPNVPDHRYSCRSVKLNPLFAFLYWQMNYHVEHHMFAGVPFYNLKKLRKVVDKDMPPMFQGLRPAWREILDALDRQKTDPSYVVVPAVPGMNTGENAPQ